MNKNLMYNNFIHEFSCIKEQYLNNYIIYEFEILVLNYE